jgi:hypothetical protein
MVSGITIKQSMGLGIIVGIKQCDKPIGIVEISIHYMVKVLKDSFRGVPI